MTIGNFIKARVESSSLFSKFRVVTISDKKGICAIYGLIKETADWKIQAYQFSIKKLWTVEKAKSWLKINNKVVKSIYSEDGLHMVIIGGKIKDE